VRCGDAGAVAAHGGVAYQLEVMLASSIAYIESGGSRTI